MHWLRDKTFFVDVGLLWRGKIKYFAFVLQMFVFRLLRLRTLGGPISVAFKILRSRRRRDYGASVILGMAVMVVEHCGGVFVGQFNSAT